ncbi:hypothetical protein SK128_006827 [Halocaridina rubra]|uniref:CUB domain-containing protein n=1 Tax=Halocaridina rubra TaxID=373956 RepID=A0AAN8WUY8_HALRR
MLQNYQISLNEEYQSSNHVDVEHECLFQWIGTTGQENTPQVVAQYGHVFSNLRELNIADRSIPEREIISSRRLEGSRLLDINSEEINKVNAFDSNTKLNYASAQNAGSLSGVLENTEFDSAKSLHQFSAQFESQDDSEAEMQNGSTVFQRDESPRAFDSSTSHTIQKSNIVDRFIDKFITNYEAKSLQDINPADYKPANWSQYYATNTTRAALQTVCGDVITLNDETPQTITSPDYPNAYPNNIQCTWTIIAQVGTDQDQVKLTFLDFELERGVCNADYLSITDHAVGESKTFCGVDHPSTVISMSNSLTLTFTTDESINKRGFQIKAEGINTTCGGVYEVNGTESFTFSTPLYPNQYPDGSKCHWLVVSKSLMVLELANYYGTSSLQDTIQITTRNFRERIPFDTNKVYASKVFSLLFEDSLTRNIDSIQPGALFQVVPVKKIKSCNASLSFGVNSTFIINSSNYPDGYDDNMECSWTLNHNFGEGYVMRIILIQFDIEDHSECEFDYLKIIDENQGINKTFCGKVEKGGYVTTSQSLTIFFKSDSYNVFVYKGFSLYVKVEKMTENTCEVLKNGPDNWVIKSPEISYMYPAFTMCNITLQSRKSQRFKIQFKEFNLQKTIPCTDGDYLLIYDVGINKTEAYCGDMEGESVLTAGNDLQIMYISDSKTLTQNFEIELTGMAASRCGGNTIMNPGTSMTLRVPAYKELDEECVWVLQGKNSTLVLDFKRVSDIRVSASGLYNDLYNYNTRTINFIDPAEKYMITSTEERSLIIVNSYATYSNCNSEFELGRESLLITNKGEIICPITVKRDQNTKENFAVQYTLLSLPQITCPLKIMDKEEGKLDRLCANEWRESFITSSTEIRIEPIIPKSEVRNNFMLLLEPIRFTCGKNFNVSERKIIVRSKDLERKSICVYRFTSDGNRIVFDIATGSKRSLEYISISDDGSFQTLRSLDIDFTTSLATRKEFLLVIQPFPRSLNFVIQVMKEMPVYDLCSTCIIVRPGSQGILVSPVSKGTKTYPNGLSCDVKFEGNGKNRAVVLEFLKIDVPTNTTLDTLMIVKEGILNVIEPTRLPPLPFKMDIETPFSLRFNTKTNNEYKGYKIGFTVQECGGVITLKDDKPMTIESPGYGKLYPTYVTCVWHIETNITSISDRIRLEILNFNIHETDSFEVYDPFYDLEPIASLTGSTDSSVIVSTGNRLRVVFTSDSRQVSTGFEFEVQAMVSGCGQDIDTSTNEQGTVSTLNFFPYTDYCLFRFRPSSGRVMSLEPVLGEGIQSIFRANSRRKDPNNKLEMKLHDRCPKGSVIVSVTGIFRDGDIYCIGEPLPAVQTTKDLLLLVKAPPLPPLEFKFNAGGCGGEINTNDFPNGTLLSPNHPEVFDGPMTCTWTSRSALLIEVTNSDLLPDQDFLNFSDSTHNVSITGIQYPYFVLLDESSTITFTGASVGIKTGFCLEYESVDHKGVWYVDEGNPAVIVGWAGMQNRPSAWYILAPQGGQGLTIMVWAAYIPSDSECSTHYLYIGGVSEEGQRICGGAGFQSIHIDGNEAIIVLHTTSPLSALAATIHVRQ